MKKILKESILKILDSLGYVIKPKLDKYHNIPVELDEFDIDLIKYVLDKGYTMTSLSRMVNTLKSCRYVVENKIRGDFVECGVWKGGNGILAKKVFEHLGSNKKCGCLTPMQE